MCLQPRTIYNPSKRLSLFGGQPLRMAVACGKCAECNKAKHNEYLLRSYYECQDTLHHGGFIYFGTLTYRNSALPHLSDSIPFIKRGGVLDYPCFSPRHIRLFRLLLNTRLRRLYPNSSYRIFLSSEYGTSEGHTHRPHYHCLFFVQSPIDPLEFTRLVSACWPHGITDGFPYKPLSFVENHICRSSSDATRIEAFSNYVSKYVQKGSTFEKEVKSRIDTLIKYNSQNGFFRVDFVNLAGDKVSISHRLNSKELREFRLRLLRNVLPFHRQSDGFGLYALKHNDYHTIFETGMMSMPTKNNVVLHIPIPMYFQRKLFYDLQRDFRDELCWRLNNRGKEYKMHHLLKSLDFISVRFKDWFDNLRNGVLPLADDVRAKYVALVDSIMSKRTWRDFGAYLLFYRGRVNSPDGAEPSMYGMPRSVEDLETWFPKIVFDGDFNFRRPKWLYNLHSLDIKPLCDYYNRHAGSPVIENYDDFYKYFVISQDSDERFRGFDDLFSIYSDSLVQYNINKNESYFRKLHLQELLKQNV